MPIFIGTAGWSIPHRLAVLLVQLPPKLAYDPTVARQFFSNLTARTSVAIACEPRHVSWFGQQASDLLQLLGQRFAMPQQRPETGAS